MIISQASPPAGFSVACDIPTNSLGTLNYQQAVSGMYISVNGGSYSVAASTVSNSSRPGTTGPWYALVTLNAADYATVGSVTFFLVDTSNNIIGCVQADVVASLGTSAPTAAQVATAVWQDTTSGDFTVSGSIGKSLFTSGNAPGASGGLFIAGTNAATTVTTSLTTTFTGSLTGNVNGSLGGNVQGNLFGDVGGKILGQGVSTFTAVGVQIGDVTLAASQPNAITFAQGIVINQSQTNTAGLSITGNGSAAALQLTSPSYYAVNISAGSHGILITAGGGGDGIHSVGDGNGAGIGAFGGTGDNSHGVLASGAEGAKYVGSDGPGFYTASTGDDSGSGHGYGHYSVGFSGAAGFAGTFDPTAMASFFAVDSGTTYASAVAGSVVKEIVTNAGGGGDPWTTALPGTYTTGQAGYIVGHNIDATVSSRTKPADTQAAVTLVATTTNLTNLPSIPNNWITTAGINDGAITDAKITVPSEPTGPATGMLSMMRQLWQRFFYKVTKDASQIKTYKADSSTTVTTQDYTSSGGTDTVDKAS